MHLYDTRDLMIADLIKPGARICEVGVFTGQFSRVLWTTKPSELVLIDIFEGINISGNQDGCNVVSADLGKSYEFLKKASEGLPIKILKGRSEEILPTFKDEWFDMIYIDGDHSYEGVKRDLLLALKKTKRGGLLLLHDYDINPKKCPYNYDFIPEINKAVKEFCKEFHYEIFAVANDGCMSCAIRV